MLSTYILFILFFLLSKTGLIAEINTTSKIERAKEIRKTFSGPYIGTSFELGTLSLKGNTTVVNPSGIEVSSKSFQTTFPQYLIGGVLGYGHQFNNNFYIGGESITSFAFGPNGAGVYIQEFLLMTGYVFDVERFKVSLMPYFSVGPSLIIETNSKIQAPNFTSDKITAFQITAFFNFGLNIKPFHRINLFTTIEFIFRPDFSTTITATDSSGNKYTNTALVSIYGLRFSVQYKF